MRHTTKVSDSRGAGALNQSRSALWRVFWSAAYMCLLMGPLPAQAIEYFCQPIDMCSWVPMDGDGSPVYHQGDGTAPWVIGGSESVSLPAGDYDVGISAQGIPIVFVMEDATLAIEDLAMDEEVGLGAWIVLCDNAQLRMRNATFRSLADFKFQFPIFALEDSRIEMENATVHALKRERHANGETGLFFQIMGGRSTLLADGFRMPTLGEPWELAAVHQSTVDVRNAEILGEFYIAGEANMSVTDTAHHNVFFEVCSHDDYLIADLPALCSFTDPDRMCLGPNHEAIDFAVGPPTTPFSLNLVNDKVFAWSASTYAGSTARVRNIPNDANFYIGLGGIRSTLELQLGPGAVPSVPGLTDRTLEFEDAYVSGWHVWPETGARITLLPGSHVGDLLPGSDDSVCIATETTFENGQLRVNEGSEIRLYDSIVHNESENLGGRLLAVETSFETLKVGGATYLADTVWPQPGLELYQDGVLHHVALSAPADGAQLHDEVIEIRGSIHAESAAGTVDPFPTVVVDLVDDDGNQVERLGTVSEMGDDVVLASLDPAGLEAGSYALRVYFEGAQEAAAHRRLVTQTNDTAPDVGLARDAGAPDSTMEVDVASGAGGGGGGCFVNSPLPQSDHALIALLAVFLVMRPRRQAS